MVFLEPESRTLLSDDGKKLLYGSVGARKQRLVSVNPFWVKRRDTAVRRIGFDSIKRHLIFQLNACQEADDYVVKKAMLFRAICDYLTGEGVGLSGVNWTEIESVRVKAGRGRLMAHVISKGRNRGLWGYVNRLEIEFRSSRGDMCPSAHHVWVKRSPERFIG